MKSLQESLFDKDLAEKELTSFKDVFKVDRFRCAANSQFKLTKLEKDIKAPGKDDSEIVINCIAKIIGDIPIPQMNQEGPVNTIYKAISPYILSKYTKMGAKSVAVWDGKHVWSSKSSDEFLNWDTVQIDILALCIRFKHK